MTSRKSAADREGWKRGAGAYSKEVKLNSRHAMEPGRPL